jgi:hypothetical protein
MHRVIKTVKVIGVVVPASLLLRADWVIKWMGYVAVGPKRSRRPFAFVSVVGSLAAARLFDWRGSM